MGIFYQDVEIVNVGQPGLVIHVPHLLVDSGSEFTWVSQALLKQAQIAVVKRKVPFLMANGRTITRSMGYAIVRTDGFETIDEVVFGRPGDLSLLGSRTLEGFGALVDPRRKRLVAGGPHPAAVCQGAPQREPPSAEKALPRARPDRGRNDHGGI